MLIFREKLIDEDFTMGIFDGITKKMSPLKEYLDFMFENKQSILVGFRKEKYKVLPWDLLRSELFFPTRKYIVDTNHFILKSHIKQHQSSEWRSGTSAIPHISTYLKLVGRRA